MSELKKIMGKKYCTLKQFTCEQTLIILFTSKWYLKLEMLKH